MMDVNEAGREKAYVIVVASAILFSIVSVVAVCISVPLGLSYVSHVQRRVQDDASFCRVTSNYFVTIRD